NWQVTRRGLLADPGRRVTKALGEQVDVEDEPTVGGFGFGEEIDQQRREPALLKDSRDEIVAWAEASAAAAMGEEHDAPRPWWAAEYAMQSDDPRGDRHFSFVRCSGHRSLHSFPVGRRAPSVRDKALPRNGPAAAI